MKTGVIPSGILERVALHLDLVPAPLFHFSFAAILARAIMVATKLGIFEALEAAPLSAREIARRCDLDLTAAEKLVNALVAAEYLQRKEDRYGLTSMTRKWLLKISPHSLHDSALFALMESDRLNELESFIRNGRALDLHRSDRSSEEWAVYQRGMRSLASLSADEVARKIPVPADARHMLDIGGSHGLFSAALCKRHPALSSVILDLPEAIEHSAPLLAQEGLGDRVVYRPGNALSDDLGTEAYDLILMSQLAHHFDEPTNRSLIGRIARALRPGGVFVLQEMVRSESPASGDQIGTLMDLYFGLTSEAGTWSLREMADWQESAGLRPNRPVNLRTMPGAVQLSAIRPAS